MKDPRGPKIDWGPSAFATGEEMPNDRFASLTAFPTDAQPFDQHLTVDWFGTDDQENLATVQFDTSTVQVTVAPSTP